ncbi:TIR domain-containing protein, partial [Plantactinospora sp. ZYX-F-223]|uniref:TIR domain-containing protein n=1 Tax=Plantactinospora sp. ZYX-F-223 TaxID=3144103 RepID=UPI0031FC6993
DLPDLENEPATRPSGARSAQHAGGAMTEAHEGEKSETRSTSRGEAIPTYQLNDVFKRSGTPTVTFVEPSDFSLFRMALRQPGLGIVIEGPSGTGKSTYLQQAVQMERAQGREIVVLSARKRDDLERIRALPAMLGSGIVAVDDFHRLSPEVQASLTHYLKLLADEESADHRLIIAGIPGTGRRLVDVASDLATRIQLFVLRKVGGDLVLRMIRKGEAALNVSFDEAERIVELAGGSLSTAQMLCWFLATQNDIVETQPTPTRVVHGLEDALSHLEFALRMKYQKAVEAFASLDGERHQACIELLLRLSSTDGVLHLDEVAGHQPELAIAIEAHLLQRFPVGFDDEVLGEHLYLDVRSRQLVVEDPQFLIYLRQQRRDELARAVGKRTLGRRNQVFISYSHRDADWLDRLKIHLSPLIRKGIVDVWADTRLNPGELWREELEAALSRARAAILIVTADFFASSFVQEVELPNLLEAARLDGCQVLPLIIKPSYFPYSEIGQFQAFNDAGRPLSGLTEHHQEQVLATVATSLVHLLSEAAPPT